MWGTSEVLDAAARAARRGDVAGLAALIDWALSGAATVGRDLDLILPPDRREVVASGLAELAEVAGRPELMEPMVGEMLPLFAAPARAADPETAESVLAALRLPGHYPAELSGDQVARLAELGEQAAGLRDVWLLAAGGHELAVACAPGRDRLVLALDWTRDG